MIEPHGPVRHLPRGVLLGYDLEVAGCDRTVVGGEAMLRQADLCYPPLAWPTFFLPDSPNPHPTFMHGSCRKLHGEGDDAMTVADAAMARRPERLPARPALLVLTGDQIYADDVDSGLIAGIAALGRALVGRDERVPYDAAHVAIPHLVPSKARGRLVRGAGFTVDEACGINHLLGFGDFAATYLASWSPEMFARISGGKGASPNNAALRRLLANVPTYMIFDDHEITDDWYLNETVWRRCCGNPTTRRVIANGLAAFAIFQAIGNEPGTFLPIAAAAARFTSGASYDADAFEATLIGRRNWGYSIPFEPPIEVLDTRTQRRLEPGRAAGLLDDPAVRDVGRRIRGHPAGDVTVLVSPAPLLGYTAIEDLQRVSSGVDRLGRPFDPSSDPEAWTFHPETFIGFLDELVDSGRSRFAILSGDVHYGFTGVLVYSRRRSDGRIHRIEVAQLTATATKNEPTGVNRVLMNQLLNPDRDLHVMQGFVNREGIWWRGVGDRYLDLLLKSRPWDFEIRWRYPGIVVGPAIPEMTAPVTAYWGNTLVRENNIGLVELAFGGKGPLTHRLLTHAGDRVSAVEWDLLSSWLEAG